jgi:hypothetical protein
LAELDAEVKHGEQQELHILFWDKTINEYVRIASDAALLDAFTQYWELRRLPRGFCKSILLGSDVQGNLCYMGARIA